MIYKKTDIYGNNFYENAFTGKRIELKRARGIHQNKIPDGVFGRFIKPAPTRLEKLINQ